MDRLPLPYPALLLAGGASRRMGRDKARLPVPGTSGMTLLERGLTVLAAALTGPLYVSLAASAAPGEVERWIRAAGRPVTPVPDRWPGAGPLEGIRAGLACIGPSAGWLAVLAVDLARVTPALWAELAPGPGDTGPVVARAGGRLQPLAGFWPAGILPALESFLAAGGRRVQDFLALVPAVPRPVSRPGWLLNVNTPAEWEAFCRAAPDPDPGTGVK